MAAGFLNALAAIPQGFMQGQQYAIDQNYQQALRELAIQQQRQQMAQNAQRQQALGLLYRAYGQAQGQQQQNPNPFGQPADLQAAQQFTPPPIPQQPSAPTTRTFSQLPAATLPPQLQQRILGIEGNRDNAVGAAGELGPGQVLPSTGRQYGYSPNQLLGDSGRQASARIAGDLYRQSGGDAAATLVGYNAGPGAMRRFQAAGDNPAAVKLSPAYAQAVRQELSPEQHEQATQVAVSTATMTPPQLAGQLDPRQLTAMIERAAGPDTPDEVKGAALVQLMQLMAPQAQRAFQRQWEEYKFGVQQQQHREDISERRQDRAAGLAQTRELAEERMDIQRQAQADRQASKTAKGDGLEASKPFDIVDDKGHVIRNVMAREHKDRAGFIDSQTGEDIKLEPGQHLRQVTATTSGGGRAGAQVLRQQVGGREVLSDLQNAVNLPVGTTTGPLGTVQPGTSIGGAVKGDLVRKLTDQDSQLMQASMASMTRELSILMSPVYGGNWAAQQIDPLVPKSGDTLGTVMFKMSRLAQSADNALEAISKSPILSNEQQEYATSLRSEIQKAIPWSPQQAMEFAQGPDKGESFGDFVKRGGLQPAGGPVPGTTRAYLGKTYTFQGGDPSQESSWKAQ